MDSSISNKDIFVALKNRSVYAFEFIFKSNYKDLLLFANYYVMNRHIAEDIVQDSFAKLWELAPDLDDDTNIQGYLYTCVKNACKNYFKHNCVKDSNYLKLAEAIVHSTTIHYEDNTEVIAKVRECLGKLSANQRNVLERRIFDLMSYKEIAEELEISELTVHTHIKRAYKFIRENYPLDFFIIFLVSNVPDF